MWGNRRQDVLDRAVLVDVTGHAQCRELADFVRAGNGPAENQYRQPPIVQLANRSHQVDTWGVRQPEVEDDQIDLRKIGADPRQQLRGTFDEYCLVSGVFNGRPEPVADKRGIVGDDDRLGRDRSRGHVRRYLHRAPQSASGI
jgi:hypothetical protein